MHFVGASATMQSALTMQVGIFSVIIINFISACSERCGLWTLHEQAHQCKKNSDDNPVIHILKLDTSYHYLFFSRCRMWKKVR
jgi:hypothetical protein